MFFIFNIHFEFRMASNSLSEYPDHLYSIYQQEQVHSTHLFTECLQAWMSLDMIVD